MQKQIFTSFPFQMASFIFFFLQLLSIASQIQARDSMFFSKFTHFNTHKKVESQIPQFQVPASSPTLAPTPAPVSKLSTQSGYGPFGPGSGLVVPKKSTTSAGNENDEFLDGEHDSESFKNNGFTTTNYNNNELYENQEKKGLSDTRYLENGKYYYDVKNKEDYPGMESTQSRVNGYSRGQNNNGYRLASSQYETGSQSSNNGFTTTNYNNELYENQEKKGMSDTRYFENGKYYYDVKNKKDYPGAESTQNQVNGYSRDQNNNGYRLASSQYETRSQSSNNGFTDNYNTNVYENGQKDTNYYAQVNENTQYQGNYFGSNEHPYEFNTMEEYEKQQGIVDLP